MKRFFEHKNLPFWILLAGGVGLMLRVWLMYFGVDKTGFIVTSHFAAVVLFLLALAVVVVVLLYTRHLLEATKYSFNFPESDIGGFGAYIAAAGIGLSSFVEIFFVADTFETVTSVLGLVAALLLVLNGYCRRRGIVPSLLIHLGLCAFLMVRLICDYRHWSSDPQILDYCFPLVATACLMLATFQRAAFAADNGNRRSYAFFCLTAVFFSCLSMVGWSNIVFFLSVVVWQITDICNLIPLSSNAVLEDDEEDYQW